MYSSPRTEGQAEPLLTPGHALPPLIASRFGGAAGRVNVLAALSRQHLFAEVPGALDLVADAVEIEHYSMGELLIEQGAGDADVFLILSGRCGVLVGRDFVGHRLPGDYVGEMAAIDTGQKRSARVVATEDSVIARVREGDFRRILWTFPWIYRRITLALAARRKGNLNALAEGTPATVAPLAAPTQAPRR